MDDRRFDELTRRLATGRTRRSVLKGTDRRRRGRAGNRGWLALAKPSPDKKVTICHYDASTGQYYEISIAQKALDKHLQNNPGDTQGACAACTPVGCQYGAWSDWSTCSEACGPGTQTSTRVVTAQPTCGGAACSEPLVQYQDCNIQDCCVPVDTSCQPGQCGNLLDNCGNHVDFCIGTPIPCVPGTCGPQVDACGTQVGVCLDYTKACSAEACGPLLDDCGNQVGDCHGGCACTPVEPDCTDRCETVFDNCGNEVECTDGCSCVPQSIPCAADACGDHLDTCGNVVGHCADGCTCRPMFEWCIPGVTTCCGADGCETWTDCNSYDNGYCC